MSNENFNPDSEQNPSGYEPSSPNLNPQNQPGYGSNQPPAGSYPPPPPGSFGTGQQGQYPPQQGQYPPQQGQYPPQPGYAPQQAKSAVNTGVLASLFDTKFDAQKISSLAPTVYLISLGGMVLYWLIMIINYFAIHAFWAAFPVLVGGPLLILAIAGTQKIFFSYVIDYVERDKDDE